MTWTLRRRRRRPTAPDRPLDCAEVAGLLQIYLDDESDAVTARRVAEHLEDCRRCGLEAEVYHDIKASLARQAVPLSAGAVARLRDFGARVAAGEDPTGEGG